MDNKRLDAFKVNSAKRQLPAACETTRQSATFHMVFILDPGRGPKNGGKYGEFVTSWQHCGKAGGGERSQGQRVSAR
jgi:hypothetical protein